MLIYRRSVENRPVVVDSKPVRDPFLLSSYTGIKGGEQLEFEVGLFAGKNLL